MRWSLRFNTDFDLGSCFLFVFAISFGLPRCDSKLGKLDLCKTEGKSDGVYSIRGDFCSAEYVRCDNGGRTTVSQCPDGFVFDGQECSKAPPECELVSVTTKSVEKAQRRCRDDEIYLGCVSSCARDCSSIIDDSSSDSTKNCNDCDFGCFCKNGFYRDIDGHCVQPEYCTQRRQFDCSDKAPQSMHSIGCSHYYWWCWNGLASKIACNANRYFNSDTNQCDFRENVAVCRGRPDYVEKSEFPPGPMTTPKPSIWTLVFARPGSIDCSKKTDGNEDDPTTPALISTASPSLRLPRNAIFDVFLATFSCQNRPNGYYSDPAVKCNKYFLRCVNNEISVFNGEIKLSCPIGSVFDPADANHPCKLFHMVAACAKEFFDDAASPPTTPLIPTL